MNALHRLKKLAMVSRPISWPNTSYPFAVGFLIASGALEGATLSGSQLAVLIVGTLYFIGPYNLLMYGVNDVYDYESDIRNPRKGGVEGMKESRAFHPTILKAVVITNAPFLLYLLMASNWQARAVLVLVVFAALAYSIKGLRFKEIPFLDSITSSFHFVSPLLFALALVGFPHAAFAWVVAFFLWGMASHAFGAVQDIIPDREGGLRSIATQLGAKTTVWFSLLTYGAATVLVLFQGFPYALLAVAGLAYIVNCLPYSTITDKESGRTNNGWKRFLWLNYASGALVTLIVILSFMIHT